MAGLGVSFGVPAKAIHLRKVAVSGDEALAVFQYVYENQSHRAVAVMKRSANTWTLVDAAADLWDTLPARGSEDYPLTTVGAKGPIGFGGFIDPAVDRIVVQAPSGSTIDADTPAEGATAAFVRGWVAILAYRDDQLLFATPMTIGHFPVRDRDIDADARAVAQEFVKDLISQEWREATRFVASGVPPNYVLPVMHRFLTRPSQRVVGGPRNSSLGVAFELDGPDFGARLDLSMSFAGDHWRVWSYTYERHA